jgi:hypothetical protein
MSGFASPIAVVFRYGPPEDILPYGDESHYIQFGEPANHEIAELGSIPTSCTRREELNAAVISER